MHNGPIVGRDGWKWARVKGGKRGLGELSADHECLQCPEPSRALMSEFWGASREPEQVVVT